jgi:hypothetical protein
MRTTFSFDLKVNRVSGMWTDTRKPTREASRSSLAPCRVELKHAPHGGRGRGEGFYPPEVQTWLEPDLLEVPETDGDLLDDVRGFVLDEVPFDADFLRGSQDGRQIGLTGAERHIIANVGAAGQVVSWHAFFEIFQVDEFPAGTIFFEELDRVGSRKNDPHKVHLPADELRFCFAHHEVEQGAVAVRLELIAVLVVHEFEIVLGEGFPGAIENPDCFACRLFIERPFVRDPCATDVFQIQRFGFGSDGLDIVAKPLIGEMAGDGFESIITEFGCELLGRQVVGAGDFNIAEAKIPHLLKRARDVLGEEVAQAVKLESERTLEVGSDASLGTRGAEGGDAHEKDEETDSEEVRSWLHG